MIIGIIDYGSGNLRSVMQATQRAADDIKNTKIILIDQVQDVSQCDKIILPGVGAFADCMGNLSAKTDMIATLQQHIINDKKPFLGICVGMQLLCHEGWEHGVTSGLGWIDGVTKKLMLSDKNLKIPHMGWNTISLNGNHELLAQCDDEYFYFAHSYYVDVNRPSDALAYCHYGDDFCVAVGRDNYIGVQFHPEKSQKNGINFLTKFVNW